MIILCYLTWQFYLFSLQQEFRKGVGHYTDEEYAVSIVHFEKALEEYFVADLECRSLCEGPYDYEGYNYMDYSADLFQSITGMNRLYRMHFTSFWSVAILQ